MFNMDIQGAPTDSADGSGMYPPPSFNANISSNQHYQSHAQGQTYYSGGQQGQGAGKKSQQSQQSSQQNQAPPPTQATGAPQVSQGMPPPQAQTQPQHSPVQPPPPPTTHQTGHQPMMQQMTGGHHIESNQYGGMRPSGGYMGNVSFS